MKTLVGWRLKEDEVNIDGATLAHYYCGDNSDPETDSSSLCERLYALKEELVFPKPGLPHYCKECQQEALRLEEQSYQ